MPEFLLYRKGSNSRNQSMTLDWVPIAVVEAVHESDAEGRIWTEKPNVHGCPKVAAKVIAHCGNLDVWSNQYLKAVAIEDADPDDLNIVYESDAERLSMNDLED